MQPFSSTHAPMTDVTSNPYLNEPAKTKPTGTLGKFAVAVQSGVTSFFSSLSPNYIPEHQRQTSQPAAPVANTLPADNKNDKTSLADSVVQGVGLASKVLSCWVPNVSAVSDAIGTICSYVSLANSLDNMAVSGKSGKEPASGSDNVSKHHSQKVTDKKQEDEKPDKPVTASGTAKRVSGPAMATATLMAMDRLAGAAALPAEGRPGAWNNPIPVEDSATLGKIGRNDSYPPDAHYQQTRSFSHNTSVPVGSDSTPFQGHYDGGCHTISDLQDCLFGELGSGADVKNLRIANATIDQTGKQHSAVLACKMSGGSAVSDVRIEHGSVATRQGVISSESVSTAGVITGLQGKKSVLKDIEIVNCSVTSSGRNTDTGAGGGWVDGNIERLTVRDTQVTSAGAYSPAGIGGGLVTGQIKQLTVVNGQVTTTGTSGHAAIGGGQVGRVFPPVAGKVSELVALKSRVNIENDHSFAAIGGGLVAGQQSEINGITAIDCSVSASQNLSWIAIGAGWNMGQVADTTAVNSSVTGRFADIGKALGSGSEKGTASLNSQVNGELKNFGNVTLPGLCRTADARFVTSDCQLNPDSLTGDHWNCSSSTATSAPVPQPTTLPITETVTANPITQPATDALTTPTTMHKTALSHTTTPLPGSKPLTGTSAAPDSPILVADSETLGKIGQPGYPLDGHYLQTKSFSHNNSVTIGSWSTPFKGDYDGGCHTISDPEGCLFGKLGRDAIVHDLHVANGAIENSDRFSAALACEMGEQSTVRDILVEDTSIINERAANLFSRTSTGVITGQQETGSLIEGVDVKNSSVTTTGNFSPAGIGSGTTRGQMKNMNVADSQVTTSGRHSDAGIGAGRMAGQGEHLAVTDSRVETRGSHSNAGIGGGKITGDIEHLTVLSSNVSTDQFSSDAGIGGGEVAGDIRTMTVIKSHVTTKAPIAYAGIGGGQVGMRPSLRPFGGGGQLIRGSVNDLVAVDSHVRTEGRLAHAGIGGGVVNDEVRGISAIDCSVSTADGSGGIGAGRKAGSTADIRSLNSQVNGELENFGSADSSELCRTADSRFVTDDCQLTSGSLTEDHWHWNCSATSIAATPAHSPAVRQYSPQTAASSTNNPAMADTTSQQPAMTSLNKTTMDSTSSLLSSHTQTTPAPYNKTTMDSTVSSLSSHTLTTPAPFNKTAMDSATSPLSSHTQTTPAAFNKTAMDSTASMLSSHTQTTPVPFNKATMDRTTSPPSSHTQTTPAPLGKTAMANTSTPLSSPALTTPALLNEMVMSNTTITGNTISTPLPSINATITPTTPLATAAMTTSAPVTETVVTLPEASMTFSGMPPATALPVTPAPLAGTISTWVVLGVSLGTAVTILAGIGLCALYQHYHRRDEAQQPADPEIPLEHLNQQANN